VKRPTLSKFDVAVLEMLFTRPAGPPIMSVADFITVPMNTLSFLSQNIEASQTIVVEEDSHLLDLDRLRDANDDYDSILFYPEREIVLKDGEYVLGMPHQKDMVLDEPSEDTGVDDQPLI
jgi:hypothetical protein